MSGNEFAGFATGKRKRTMIVTTDHDTRSVVDAFHEGVEPNTEAGWAALIALANRICDAAGVNAPAAEDEKATS